MKCVVVAMSGGVDSSVTAYLIKEMGYDVIGVTMEILKSSCQIEKLDTCCSLQSFVDARYVAERLGIRHHIIDCKAEFEQMVVSYFVKEYLAGRTPNPCVICNSRIKFDSLLAKAKELGADYLATGHYARLEKQNNRYIIKKGIDTTRDQSYFLYKLSQEQLSQAMMPLGDYQKQEVRKIAVRLGLKVANKPESQEICFIPQGDYRNFIQQRIKDAFKPGEILDKNGNILGRHSGIAFFTIGQRRGLGIAAGSPLYVISIELNRNAVIVGDESDLYRNSLIAGELNWVAVERFESEMEVVAKIRYLHPETKAIIHPVNNDKVEVVFEQPVRAVTPGQSVVFYKDEVLLGGGVIE
ncbi:MAG: tRNA 2-thiouridine(34) synthase MnmA [bacterium]